MLIVIWGVNRIREINFLPEGINMTTECFNLHMIELIAQQKEVIWKESVKKES